MNAIGALARTRVGAAALLVALAFAGSTCARSTGLLKGPEFAVYDFFLRLRAEPPAKPLPVTLVHIREDDIQRYGYPINDELLRQAIQNLIAAEPRAVGIDLYRDLPVPPGTDALRSLLKNDARIIAIEKVGGPGGEAVKPPPDLSSEQVGFSDFPVDRGGIVRRGLLYLWDREHQSHCSFALRLAALYLGTDGIAVEPDPDDPLCVRIGASQQCPLEAGHGGYVGIDDKGFQYLLDYASGPEAVASLTLQEAIEKRFKETIVRDRVVILGTTAASVQDSFFTPLAAGAHDAPLAGALIHSLAVGQIIQQAQSLRMPIRTLPVAAEWALMLLAAILGGLVGLRLHASWAFARAVSVGVAAIGIGCFALFRQSLWVPPVQISAAWTGASSLVALQLLLQERNEKKVIRDLFEGMLGKEVFSAIWAQREQFIAQGSIRSQVATITVLMTDLKGFTEACTTLDAPKVMKWINEYMAEMAKIIAIHDGVVDDYAGDGIKADFGIPPRGTDDDERMDLDAINAVRAALAMADALDRLNRDWTARNLPTGRMRAGIHTGEAVLGTMGAGTRVKYTSIGDMVNTASRLESFDKDAFASETGSRILISEKTWRRLRARFDTQDLGEHELKGLAGKIHVFRVLGDKASRNKEIS